MSVTLTNFKAVCLENTPGAIHIDKDGNVIENGASDARVIDCNGAYLSAGWCDLHVHIWHGGTDISIRPEQAGRPTGVTAMADAGSAGEASFHGLREYIIEPSAETIRAFLNIGSIGLVACNRVPELIDLRSIDIDRTLEVVEANRDVICGIKVRASGVIVGTWGITPAKIAKRVAEITNLPLMVHVGEPPPLIDEVFDILGPGDIVTHCFNGKRAGSISDTQALFDKAVSLADKGVVMDIGHGVASFDFATAERAIKEGFLPDTISTDLHLRNVDGPVHDLALTASKLIGVGMPFEDCIRAITTRPRKVMGLAAGEAYNVGAQADFTIFKLADAEKQAVDSLGNTLDLKQLLAPQMTVIGTSVEKTKSASS